MFKLFSKRKKGFTLTETIVVVALIGLIMLCVVAFSTPVRTMLSNTNAKADAVTINKIIGSYIEHRLSYANDVSIITEVNFDDAANNTLKDKFDIEKSGRDTNDTTCMMVFRYEPAGIGDEPFSSTYKLYDVVIDTTSWSYLNAANEVFSGRAAAFIDDFYQGFEYFIAPSGEVDVNSIKQKAYLKFEVTSFNFTDRYGYQLKSDTLSKYMTPVLTGSVLDRGVNLMPEEKLATENVSFTLENVKTTGSIAQTASIDSCKGTPDEGDDIVIFYNIRRF